MVLFPDLGATTVWQDKLPMMQVLGIRATLFDFLEHQACEEDKAKGLDIADYLLKIKPTEAKLQALIKQNPAIRKLIDVFKLEKLLTSLNHVSALLKGNVVSDSEMI